MDQKEFHTVVLAALLHDIGKLYQRGNYGMLVLEGQHPKLGADFAGAFKDFFGQWVAPDLLQTLVQRHHQNEHAFPPELLAQGTPDPHHRALAFLVGEADHLSAAERGLHDRGQLRNPKTVPLGSIFQSLETPPLSPLPRGTTGGVLARGDNGGVANLHATAITDAASLENAFPDTSLTDISGELTQHIRAFGEEFNQRLRPKLTGDFPSVLAHLLNFLYRYTWCIPADTQEDNPDISLYDHLRTTCAIAACLYRVHDGKQGPALEAAIASAPADPEFLLVAGDVSGIQSYIFGISHIGEGGVARRLRARSLMVQLFTEAAARTILERLGLPQACQVMAAGGNFYLLLPNTPQTQATLEQASPEIDGWCLKELHGELALNLAWVKLARGEFQGGGTEGHGFGDVLRRVNEGLQERKRRRFQGALSEGGAWNENSFVLDVHYHGEAVCPSCRRFPSQEGEHEHLCRWCHTDKETGKQLPVASLVSMRRDNRLGIVLPGGWSAAVATGPKALADGDVALQLNRFDLEGHGRREATARFVANHVPTGHDGHTLLTFEGIAGRSQGRKMLGFLKMDVDNLGELMVFGLKRSNPDASGHRDTISRIMTLSRSLETFFSGWVQHLLEVDFPNCYAVFSGGDDLFVSGPWDKVLELAARVRQDFRRWVARDDITISAGVVLTHPSYPISRAAAEAEEALERSKHRDGSGGVTPPADRAPGPSLQGGPQRRPGKDAITLLDHTLSWKDWDAICQCWKALEEWTLRANTSTALMYSLLEYGRMWRRYQRWRKDPQSDPGGVLGLRFQPLLAYNIARNLDPKKAPELYAWAEAFTRPGPFPPERQLELDNLDLLAELLIYAKGRNNE